MDAFLDYISLPTIPIMPTPTFTYSQHSFAITNSGTGGSFSLVKCNCNSRLTILMKLAIEKTDIESEVSFSIARRGCVRWYKKVNVCCLV